MSEKDLQKKVAELEAQVRKLKKSNLGLVFEDKTEDVVEQSKTKVPVLKEVVKNRLDLSAEYPNNLMIEGDNYLALSVLNYTHKKNIDLIYIDPPYNTGAKDWKYNNDYVDNEDAFRHSKWLSFMRHRLNLAKYLLRDDGVLICSIDDYEVNTLGLLFDELFPNLEKNLIIVEHHPQGGGSAAISRTHEYAYVLIPKGCGLEGRVTQEEEANWSLKRSGQGENNWRKNRPNQFFAILVDTKTFKVKGVGPALSRNDKYSTTSTFNGLVPIYPLDKKGGERVWRYNRESMQELIDLGQIHCSQKLTLTVRKTARSITTPIFSVWKGSRYNAGTQGSNLLTEIMGEANTFPYPKSLYTVYDMIAMVARNRKKAIILDYFAGSGTTGHAVLQLNSEDNGNRKFILCTNNENNNGGKGGIAESVCYPRIKSVINGYKNKKSEKVAGLPSNLFYYQTDLVGIDQIHKVPDDAKVRIAYEAGEMIAVREDTLNEVEKNDWWQIFEGKCKLTAIYFKEDKTKLVELIAKLEKKNMPTSLYIFSWGKNEYKGEHSTANIRVEDIPEPIIEVYKELNRI